MEHLRLLLVGSLANHDFERTRSARLEHDLDARNRGDGLLQRALHRRGAGVVTSAGAVLHGDQVLRVLVDDRLRMALTAPKHKKSTNFVKTIKNTIYSFVKVKKTIT